MNPGHQLLASYRMTQLLAEAESERLASMSRRRGHASARTGRARSVIALLLRAAAPRRRAGRMGVTPASHELRGQGVASLPATGHRA